MGENGFRGAAAVLEGVAAGFGFARRSARACGAGAEFVDEIAADEVVHEDASSTIVGGWGVLGGGMKQGQAIDLEWNGRFRGSVMA